MGDPEDPTRSIGTDDALIPPSGGEAEVSIVPIGGEEGEHWTPEEGVLRITESPTDPALGESTVPPTPVVGTNPRTRRWFLGALGAAGAAAVAGGYGLMRPEKNTDVERKPAPPPETPPVEAAVETPATPVIDFFGHQIEIADEETYKLKLEKALQFLLLKFGENNVKVNDETTGEMRWETNEEKWTRKIEVIFRDILMEMSRYEDAIRERAQALGVHEDAVAFFGIESGFDPLKSSPTGYKGLGQVGVDAVRDVRDKVKGVEHPIEDKDMGEWEDLRFDATHGIENGVGYLKYLVDEIPDTIGALLRKYKKTRAIKTWLSERLDDFEQKLNLDHQPALNFNQRYERLLDQVLGSGDLTILDKEGFAIHAYNMGGAGSARIIWLNLINATINGQNLATDGRVSAFTLENDASKLEESITPSDTSSGQVKKAEDDDVTVASFDFNMGEDPFESGNEAAKDERETYLWQVYAFTKLMKEWGALGPGETLKIPFEKRLGGKTYQLVKPHVDRPDFREDLNNMVEIEVPVGLDLIRFAEHIGYDHREGIPDEERDHHRQFRVRGNGQLIRGGAYEGDPLRHPKKYAQKDQTVTVRVPRDQEAKARAYLDNEPPKVKLYKVKSGDNAAEIIEKLRRANPEVEAETITEISIFWEYNDFRPHRRQKQLKAGETIVIPSHLNLL